MTSSVLRLNTRCFGAGGFRFSGKNRPRLDPACTFWTATDRVAASALSGAIRKQRGVKPGVPDMLVLYRGKLTAIELKSRRGKYSPSQRAVREVLLRAGAQW